MINRLKEQKGFTLSELMVALVISSIILMPLFDLYINSNKMSTYIWRQSILLEESQNIFSKIIEGNKGNRKGLKHASQYNIPLNPIISGRTAPDSVAFKVGSQIIGYYWASDGNLYMVDNLSNVNAPTSGGNIVLKNVELFSIQKNTTTNILTVILKTSVPTQTGMKTGGTFKTKVLPRGI